MLCYLIFLNSKKRNLIFIKYSKQRKLEGIQNKFEDKENSFTELPFYLKNLLC